MEHQEPSIYVELFPEDGHCPQQCSHCSYGVKKTKNNSGKPFFSKEAIHTLGLLEEYSYFRNQCIHQLFIGIGLDPKNVDPLPLDPLPNSIMFILGDVTSGFSKSKDIDVTSDAELQAVVHAVVTAAHICLQNADKNKDPFALGFSILPQCDEKLVPQNIKFLQRFFSLLFQEILKDPLDLTVNGFFIELTQNAVRSDTFEKVSSDHQVLLTNDQVLREITRPVKEVLTLAYGPFTKGTFYPPEIKKDIMGFTTQYQWSNRTIFAVNRRIIRQPESKQQLQDLDLQTEELSFGLTTNGVWINHSALNVGDRSLKIPYHICHNIIASCIMGGSTLQEKIYREIQRNRDRRLPLV